MRQGTTNADEYEVPDGVLQHRAVTHFQDMFEIGLVAARTRLGERHVTDAPCRFRQAFRGNLRVRFPRDAVVLEKPIQLGIIHDLPAEQINGRLADDANVLGGIESGHAVSW